MTVSNNNNNNKRRSTEQKLKSKVRILFLSANPDDTTRLKVEQEVNRIEDKIAATEGFRDQFELKQRHAITLPDLQSQLLRFKPHVVHFSGHGSNKGKLIFENPSSGEHQEAPPGALSRLFKVMNQRASNDEKIGLAVLNACYSENLAKAISESVDCVVGVSDAIKDTDAIAFAVTFYEALSAGKDIETAFENGRVAIDFESNVGLAIDRDIKNVGEVGLLGDDHLKSNNNSNSEIVKLLCRQSIDPSEIFLAKNETGPEPTFEWENRPKVTFRGPRIEYRTFGPEPKETITHGPETVSENIQPNPWSWWDPSYWWNLWWDPYYIKKKRLSL
jgi:CHAT domain